MKKRLFPSIFLSLMATLACAHPTLGVQIISPYDIRQYDRDITQLYNALPNARNETIEKRITAISGYFLGKKYQLDALGEGYQARFDQDPLYRTDVFDCMTYVSTVLALAQSNNLDEFKQTIQRINYHDNKISFLTRNHFVSTDWNVVNEKNGYIQDITQQFLNDRQKTIAITSTTIITKPQWFRTLPASRIKLIKPISPEETKQLIKKFHDQANQVKNEKSVIAYLPLTALFDKNGQPHQHRFDQIPSGSIVEIVRPAWDLRKEIGTRIQVSHLGFAIRTENGELRFREASSELQRVVDIPLSVYLKRYLHSPTVKGINIQRVIEPVQKTP